MTLSVTLKAYFMWNWGSFDCYGFLSVGILDFKRNGDTFDLRRDIVKYINKRMKFAFYSQLIR